MQHSDTIWPEILARIKFGGRYGIDIRVNASDGLFDMRTFFFCFLSRVTFDLSQTHAVAVASDARLDILDLQM